MLQKVLEKVLFVSNQKHHKILSNQQDKDPLHLNSLFSLMLKSHLEILEFVQVRVCLSKEFYLKMRYGVLSHDPLAIYEPTLYLN